jgi:hypothetical protein
MRKLILKLPDLIVTLFVCLSAARADVKITVHFTKINNERSRDETRIYVISKEGRLHISRDGSVTSREVQLGKPEFEYTANNKVRYVARDIIRDGKLVVGSFFYSYKVVATITTDGVSHCSATREYKLNPGFDRFQDAIDSKAYSRIAAEGVSCEIAEIK